MRISSFLCLPALIGCGSFGHVNQGQVVEYQRSHGLITLISDSNYRDPSHPRFDVLPPVTIRVPRDPREMGPAPEPGRLLLLDCAHGRAVIFDSRSQEFRTLACAPISDRPAAGGSGFPVVDRERGIVSAYSPYDRRVITFSVPAEFRDLPDVTWKFGDEVRYYYKNPLQALRLMNVSKTDFTK
jgi:hypothetical protein